MTKLIIQIPCYNEERSLPVALAELPRTLPGIDVIEWLVIDDGSTDRTAEVARSHGVDHVVAVHGNRGLANGFRTGLRACIELGADIIVNTDADNQYVAADIEKLVAPILEGRAEMVIGARPISHIGHFSVRKKFLQKLGSWVVRAASGTTVADAPSGFRAFSRETAKRLNVFSEYSYTLETIIQAGRQRMRVVSVPIRTNPDIRPSRLLKSIASYVRYSGTTIIRVFVAYNPLAFFGVPAALSLALGLALGGRFLYYWLQGSGSGHVQSLILAAVLLLTGAFLGLIALIADIISVNRKLLEKVDFRVGEIEERLRLLAPPPDRGGQGRTGVGDGGGDHPSSAPAS
jgi:glycosyltransferase involved in cell wall biosynthesis